MMYMRSFCFLSDSFLFSGGKIIIISEKLKETFTTKVRLAAGLSVPFIVQYEGV